jgi:hypothetical protein
MLDPFAIIAPVRDPDGHIADFEYAYANTAMGENAHVDREALIGRRLLDVRPAHRSSGLFEMYCHTLDSGEPLVLDGFSYEDEWGGELKVRRYDIRANRLDDALACTWRDVTPELNERQALEDRVLQQATISRLSRWSCLGDGGMHVAPDRIRDRLTDDLAAQDDVDHGEVLGIEAEFDGPTYEEWLDPVAVGEQRHRGGLCHPAGDRPPEGLADDCWIGAFRRTVGEEAGDGRGLGLGVHTGVGDLLGPGHERVVELFEALDARSLRLGQETLTYIAVQPFLLSPPSWRVGLGVNEVHAEHGTGPGELGGAVWGAVIEVQIFGHTTAADGGTQHLLAGAGVLLFHPPALDQKAGVVVDEQEKLGAARSRPARVGDERPDEDVADPDLVAP